jgi:hypothetical protein
MKNFTLGRVDPNGVSVILLQHHQLVDEVCIQNGFGGHLLLSRLERIVPA